MHYLKHVILSLVLLVMTIVANATGVLERAANPQQEVWTFSQSATPFIKASSGSIADNCAITAMTALPKTFSGGAYLYLPAGAIAAGVPAAADWYWFVASSTTAGTCYNNTYSSNKTPNGTPLIPPSPTAFATTGPGAYTGATGAVTAVSLTLPGGSLGKNGHLFFNHGFSNNNSGGTKTDGITFGGTTVSSLSTTTAVSTVHTGSVANRGVTNLQVVARLAGTSASVATGVTGATDVRADTTGAVTIAYRLNCGTATDHHILEFYSIEVRTAN